ncbi:hypothetical protein ACIROD_16030 [Peribacillus sp. NPDC101481]
MLKQSQLERVFETPAGKAGLGETSRRKPWSYRTARGKRVPGVI